MAQQELQPLQQLPPQPQPEVRYVMLNDENKNVTNNYYEKRGDDTCSVCCCFLLGCCIPCVWAINCCLNSNSPYPNSRCWVKTGCILEIIRFFPLIAGIVVLICFVLGVGAFAGTS